MTQVTTKQFMEASRGMGSRLSWDEGKELYLCLENIFKKVMMCKWNHYTLLYFSLINVSILPYIRMNKCIITRLILLHTSTLQPWGQGPPMFSKII